MVGGEGGGGKGLESILKNFSKILGKTCLNCTPKWYNFHTIEFSFLCKSDLFFFRKSRSSFFQVSFEVPYYKWSLTCKLNYLHLSAVIFETFFIHSFQVCWNRQCFICEISIKKIIHIVNNIEFWVSGYLNI